MCPWPLWPTSCQCAHACPCALHTRYLRKCHMLHHVHAHMICAFMLSHWTSYGLCCHIMHAHVLHCTYCTRCGLHVMSCIPMCYAVSITSLMAIYIVPLLYPCVILCIPACCPVHMLLYPCTISCATKVFD